MLKVIYDSAKNTKKFCCCCLKKWKRKSSNFEKILNSIHAFWAKQKHFFLSFFFFISYCSIWQKSIQKYFAGGVKGNYHDTLTPFVLLAGETSRAVGLAMAELKDRAAASAFCCLPACSASSCSLRISSKSLTFLSHSATTLAQLPMQLLPAVVLPALVCRYRADRRGKLSYPPPRTNKLANFRDEVDWFGEKELRDWIRVMKFWKGAGKR